MVAKGCGQVQTNQASPAYIGAMGHTNNTGELTALGEALRWLTSDECDREASLLLRPDSEYAMSVAIGDCVPARNREN